MEWPRAEIYTVAPAGSSNKKFDSNEKVWNLTLDQITSETGVVVNRKICSISNSGSSTYIFDENNVLYSKLRPYLNKVICPSEPGVATTELVPLRPDPNIIHKKFLMYYLRSVKFLSFANSTVSGTKMPRVNMTKFWKHKIPLPPLSEQRKIVEILDQADNLRKLRAEADRKAERILPALFYKMFGDPVLNQKSKDAIPLSKIVDINPKNGKNDVDDSTLVSFIPMAAVDDRWGRILKYEDREAATVKKGYIFFREDDVLFAKITPCMQNGKAAIATGLTNDIGFGSTEFHVLRSIRDKCLKEWVYGLIRLKSFRRQAEARFTGSVGQQRVPQKFLENYKIIAPSMNSQIIFSKAVNNIINTVEQYGCSHLKINSLFENLLYRAFSGDLTAKWREAHMKELLVEMEQQTKALKEISEEN